MGSGLRILRPESRLLPKRRDAIEERERGLWPTVATGAKAVGLHLEEVTMRLATILTTKEKARPLRCSPQIAKDALLHWLSIGGSPANIIHSEAYARGLASPPIDGFAFIADSILVSCRSPSICGWQRRSAFSQAQLRALTPDQKGHMLLLEGFVGHAQPDMHLHHRLQRFHSNVARVIPRLTWKGLQVHRERRRSRAC